MDYRVKNLYMQIGLIAVATVLVGGFGGSSVYGQSNGAINFKTPFTSTGVPLCGGDSVTINGIANFVFHEFVASDGSVHLNLHMNYMSVKAIDTSGNQYVAHETDLTSINENSNVRVFHTVVTATLIPIKNGEGTNTGITLVLQTVIDTDGNAKTIVEHVDVRCNG
jgi:hypothetical protein